MSPDIVKVKKVFTVKVKLVLSTFNVGTYGFTCRPKHDSGLDNQPEVRNRVFFASWTFWTLEILKTSITNRNKYVEVEGC